MDQELSEAARLTDPSFYAGNPHPVYARLRAEAPVFWCQAGQFWALSKYEDVRRVGHDTALFSSRRGTLLTDGRARDAGGPHAPGAGVPRERLAQFWAWTDSAIAQMDAGRGDPGLAKHIDDLMAFFGELLAFCRTATAATEIRGQRISADDYVALRAFPDFQVTGAAVRGKSTLVAIVEQLPAVFGARAHAAARA
jgi:hypothetical protein